VFYITFGFTIWSALPMNSPHRTGGWKGVHSIRKRKLF